jgi:hypothetical protein
MGKRTTDRRSFRLGGGEYQSVPPAPELRRFATKNLAAEDGRTRFLKAALRLEPAVSHSLLQTPYELLVKTGENPGRIAWLEVTQRPDLRDCCRALEAWGERWNLSQGWCLEYVFALLVWRMWTPDQRTLFKDFGPSCRSKWSRGPLLKRCRRGIPPNRLRRSIGSWSTTWLNDIVPKSGPKPRQGG